MDLFAFALLANGTQTRDAQKHVDPQFGDNPPGSEKNVKIFRGEALVKLQNNW